MERYAVARKYYSINAPDSVTKDAVVLNWGFEFKALSTVCVQGAVAPTGSAAGLGDEGGGTVIVGDTALVDGEEFDPVDKNWTDVGYFPTAAAVIAPLHENTINKIGA